MAFSKFGICNCFQLMTIINFNRRTFECMQTFPNPNPSMGLASFTTVPGYNQIVAGGKSLYSFQWDRPSKPNLTMNDPIEVRMNVYIY